MIPLNFWQKRIWEVRLLREKFIFSLGTTFVLIFSAVFYRTAETKAFQEILVILGNLSSSIGELFAIDDVKT